MSQYTKRNSWKLLKTIFPIFIFTLSYQDLNANELKDSRNKAGFNHEIRENVSQPQDVGTLKIYYTVHPDLFGQDDLRIRLIRPDGVATSHPAEGKDKEIPLKRGKLVIIQQILPGEYALELVMDSAKDYVLLEKRVITIQADKTETVHIALENPLKVDKDKDLKFSRMEEKLNQLSREIEKLQTLQAGRIAQNGDTHALRRQDILGNDQGEMKEMDSKLQDQPLAPAPVLSHQVKPAPSSPQINIHGFVWLSVGVYDATPGPVLLLQPTPIQIPLETDLIRRHSETCIDARWSRFWIEGRHEFCGMKLYGKIEADFFTVNGVSIFLNSRACRVRHAFFRADTPGGMYLLVGQYWNLATVVEMAVPFLAFCDLAGPAGSVIDRQPQLRLGYIRQLPNYRGEVDFFVGIQQQSIFTDTLTAPLQTQIALDPAQGEPFVYPVLVAGMQWRKWAPLEFDVRGGVTQNRFVLIPSGDKTERVAWFGRATIQSKVWKPLLYASYGYYDGMNRFILLSFFDAVLDSSLRIRNVKGHGGYVGSLWTFCNDIKFNMIFGWAWAREIDDTIFSHTFPRALHKIRSKQFALARNFWGDYVTMAIEYKRWDVKNFAGDRGDLDMYLYKLVYHF